MFRGSQPRTSRPRRFRRWPPASWIVLGCLCGFVTARVAQDRLWPPSARGGSSEIPTLRSVALISGPCEVLQVVTGDTLVVRQSVPNPAAPGRMQVVEARVRLLGIATSENERWATPAAEQTRKLVAADAMRLELDKRRVDRYGDFLAYVYCDGELLNETLVRAGLARLDNYPGDNATVYRRLSRAEADAKRHGRGIWSLPDHAQSMPVR